MKLLNRSTYNALTGFEIHTAYKTITSRVKFDYSSKWPAEAGAKVLLPYKNNVAKSKSISFFVVLYYWR